jgi:hypothetical protein
VEAAVTIYNTNLGLVREIREVELPAGPFELAFEDVASGIRAETVHVKPIEGGSLDLLEQNYRYDVLNPAALMAHYVGEEVGLVRVVSGTGETVRRTARLLSIGEQAGIAGAYGAYGMYGGGAPAATPWDYVYEMDGGITSGLYDRIVLPPEVPAGFVSRPSLFWSFESPAAGRRRIEAAYLTYGMTWKADYVLVLQPDGRRGDVTGWVTLSNDAGVSFDDARLQLVAGDVNVVPQPDTGMRARRSMVMLDESAAWSAEDQTGFVEEGLFEYHLYSLGRRTNLRDREQKQIELLSGRAIPVERYYRLRGTEYWLTSRQTGITEGLHPAVWLEFVNAEAAGLGMPFPAGSVRVYQTESGRDGGRQFVGESAIRHISREERIKVRVGQAFDVVADRRQVEYRVLADGLVETSWEIKLRNRRSERVTVEVREPTSGDWEVLSSSVEAIKESQREVRFDVDCPPDVEVTLTYRLRVRYA